MAIGIGKRRWLYLVTICALGVLLGFMPFRLIRPANSIRAGLLAETPIGSSVANVQAYLTRHGLSGSHSSAGYLNQNRRPPEIVGSSSIRANLGDYWLPFVTNVTASWGFDDSGNLVDIWVWKTTDAP